jgi:nitrate/TMAO reductase-like tetraheme cytochrome c subunit
MINLLLIFFSINFLSAGENRDQIPMNLQKRPLAPRANECQLCHIKRIHREVFIPSKNNTKREHFEIEISHGSLKKSCNDCHDVNNSNKLVFPATFENTSLLCSRCHSERYIEWQKGIHGKKVGSWKNNISFHCIDCHNPHSVSFKKMQSRPAPKSIKH